MHVQARESLGQLQTSDLADQPGVIASMAAADEACGDMGRAMQAIQAALQQQKQGKGAKGADRTQWLLQRLAGLQLKVSRDLAPAKFGSVPLAGGLGLPEDPPSVLLSSCQRCHRASSLPSTSVLGSQA